jgi:hypothetical protein
MSRKAYFQEYYQKHREQFIEYYQLHREEILKRQSACPLKQKEYQRRYYEKRKALRQETKVPKEPKAPKHPKPSKPPKEKLKSVKASKPKETLIITKGCFTLSFDF